MALILTPLSNPALYFLTATSDVPFYLILKTIAVIIPQGRSEVRELWFCNRHKRLKIQPETAKSCNLPKFRAPCSVLADLVFLLMFYPHT